MTVTMFSGVSTKPETKVKGESTIIHAIRKKLKLTCDEYVFLDLFRRAYLNKKDLDDNIIYNKIGFEPRESTSMIEQLSSKGLMNKEGKLTNIFLDCFSDLEKEFNEFWHFNDRVFWPGGKSVTYKAFIKAREKYSFEHIMRCRKGYMKILESQPYRQKMIGTRFLNNELDADYNVYEVKINEPVLRTSILDKEDLFR